MWELLVVACVGAFGVLLFAAAGRLPGAALGRAATLACGAGAILALVLVGVAIANRVPRPVPQPDDAPLQALEDDYTASTACWPATRSSTPPGTAPITAP